MSIESWTSSGVPRMRARAACSFWKRRRFEEWSGERSRDAALPHGKTGQEPRRERVTQPLARSGRRAP